MICKLYNNTSDRRVVSKTINNIDDISVILKDNTDILHPVLLINHSNISSFKNCNYCFLEEFGRYYYIDNITHAIGNQVELHCSIDVLMTYKQSIHNLKACISRQEFKRNTNIVDNEIITQANNSMICKQVGNPVNAEYQIYLTTCGGV